MVMVLVAVLAGSASAGRKAGVTMPDSIIVAGQRLVLNGMGLREATWLDIDVYVAGLYVQHPTSNPDALIHDDEIKTIVLQFVRDVGHDDIVKAWRDGFAANATVPLAQLQPYIDQLDAWMPSFAVRGVARQEAADEGPQAGLAWLASQRVTGSSAAPQLATNTSASGSQNAAQLATSAISGRTTGDSRPA